MLRLDKVAKYFGGRVLFEDVSFTLEAGARVGLVGANGSGKTTIFRILTGEMEADAGRIVCPKGTTLGHLQQDVGDIGEASLLDFVLAGRADILELRRRLDTLTLQLDEACSDPEETLQISDEIGEVTDRLDALDGYTIEARAQSVLLGIGFRPDQLGEPARSLSGGWRVRLVLAKLLLRRPDILLLDEPTNHLDVPSVEWLEGFLDTYPGAVVIVSHDRYFLNRLVTSIVAIEPGGIHVQPGDYDAYEAGVAERAEHLERTRARQEREVKHLKRFITRFRAKATKARQVQSRVKRLERIDLVDTMEKRKRVRTFAFSEAPREGKDVAVLRGVSKSYGDTRVYASLDFRIGRGERVVLVGPNGQGKTTLLKLIVGQTNHDDGDIEIGHNVSPAYFGQHQVEDLTLGRTLLERNAPEAAIEALRQGLERGLSGPRPRYLLGQALARTQQPALAIEAFEAALAIEGFADAKSAQQELARLRTTLEEASLD